MFLHITVEMSGSSDVIADIGRQFQVIYTVAQNDILLLPWKGNFMWVVM